MDKVESEEKSYWSAATATITEKRRFGAGDHKLDGAD
jgi:hypothetical protein